MSNGRLDIDAMKASWLEAVANNCGLDFARHFVPDILAELEIARKDIPRREKILRDALEDGPCTCTLSDNSPDAKVCLCDPCIALVECYGEGASR